MMSIFGCKTTRKIIEKNSSDTIKNVSEKIITKYDSIYIYNYDSVFLKEKNDTVFLEKYIFKTKYQIKIDTIKVTDTILRKTIKTVTNTEIQEKKVYVKWLFWLGLAIPILLFAGWKILKIYVKF